MLKIGVHHDDGVAGRESQASRRRGLMSKTAQSDRYARGHRTHAFLSSTAWVSSVLPSSTKTTSEIERKHVAGGRQLIIKPTQAGGLVEDGMTIETLGSPVINRLPSLGSASWIGRLVGSPWHGASWWTERSMWRRQQPIVFLTVAREIEQRQSRGDALGLSGCLALTVSRVLNRENRVAEPEKSLGKTERLRGSVGSMCFSRRSLCTVLCGCFLFPCYWLLAACRAQTHSSWLARVTPFLTVRARSGGSCRSWSYSRP